jgi:hypothetical protein
MWNNSVIKTWKLRNKIKTKNIQNDIEEHISPINNESWLNHFQELRNKQYEIIQQSSNECTDPKAEDKSVTGFGGGGPAKLPWDNGI